MTRPATSEAARPRFSVVMPSFNQAAFIERSLQSIADQSWADTEVWVMDGGSSDGTVAILERQPPWVRWISEPDRGQGDAVNKGWARCQGEILGWLNSDDTYLPGCFDRVAAELDAHPEAGGVCGDVKMTDPDDRVLAVRRCGAFNTRHLIRMGTCYVFQPTVFLRRQVVEAVGPLDLTLRHAMDYEYWIRVGRKFQISYVPQPLATWRLHGASKTVSDRARQIREGREVRSRYLGGGLADRLWASYYDLRVRAYLATERYRLRAPHS